ncbi:MAG: copper transporter, partial [Bifidobacteriaceae bacterium]|nr:copper transporter [Bifidobacteriaceae bacterium]
MINFRYHLVSLICVFLALAVGIVLGAGPLRDPITANLDAQVTSLREEKDSLREDLASAEADLDYRDGILETLVPIAVDAMLPAVQVALVSVGPVD